MKRNLTIYLKDIVSAIYSIEEFVKDQTFEEFFEDDKTSSAVMRKLEIIGEASKQIPAEIKQKHLDIPWKEMAGMRDKLIHFYFGTDYKLIWKTITERISEIKPKFEEILKELPDEN